MRAARSREGRNLGQRPTSTLLMVLRAAAFVSTLLLCATGVGCDRRPRVKDDAAETNASPDSKPDSKEQKKKSPLARFQGKWTGTQDGVRTSLDLAPTTLTLSGEWGSMGPLRHSVTRSSQDRLSLDVDLPGEGAAPMKFKLSEDGEVLTMWEDPDDDPIRLRRRKTKSRLSRKDRE